MRASWIETALGVGLAVALVGPLSAQQRPGQPSIMEEEPDANVPATSTPATPSPKPAKRTRAQAAPAAQQTNPDLDAEDQLAPSQIKQPMPAAVANPGSAAASKPAHAAAMRPPATIGKQIVACSGPFAKDSSNLKLAMAFDPKNVTYTDVDFNGSKVGASILFGKDPKRRLEIWWQNPANRSGTYLILINGQSTWTAPGGMKLGLTLQELEKLNHKPFKIKGFDKDHSATVSDWDGGALATITGGCKSGVSMQPDAKASADEVSALSADHEYSSSDPALRAVKPKVSEILIGY
ncbi:MAG TPA: hypothetical protein VMG39_07080 [Pseudolabrys sp.]|nr:hypothetical protein [Pseudolabrys sp.]